MDTGTLWHHYLQCRSCRKKLTSKSRIKIHLLENDIAKVGGLSQSIDLSIFENSWPGFYSEHGNLRSAVLITVLMSLVKAILGSKCNLCLSS